MGGGESGVVGKLLISPVYAKRTLLQETFGGAFSSVSSLIWSTYVFISRYVAFKEQRVH